MPIRIQAACGEGPGEPATEDLGNFLRARKLQENELHARRGLGNASEDVIVLRKILQQGLPRPKDKGVISQPEVPTKQPLWLPKHALRKD